MCGQAQGERGSTVIIVHVESSREVFMSVLSVMEKSVMIIRIPTLLCLAFVVNSCSIPLLIPARFMHPLLMRIRYPPTFKKP